MIMAYGLLRFSLLVQVNFSWESRIEVQAEPELASLIKTQSAQKVVGWALTDRMTAVKIAMTGQSRLNSEVIQKDSE